MTMYRNKYNVITKKNNEAQFCWHGPPIMKDENRGAMIKIKLGKAKGQDSISGEFEDYGTDKIAHSSAKYMTQFRLRQTLPNLCLEHC